MPGIVGLITKKPREWAEPQLMTMVEALRHESFYASGTWIDVSQGVYVGWTALENSFSDGMPLHNEESDIHLVFSGEEFCDPGTPRRLRERGHALNGRKASYLVHLYEDNPSFLSTLNGRFHGLLNDRRRGLTTLFNDRYGMHSIYYHESKDAFYFSAEVKGILKVRPELRRLDPRGFGELVACGCALEDRTVFEGIRLLPPGSAWSFRAGEANEKKAYFRPEEWESQTPLDPETYYRELRTIFTRNISRYFDDEQVGMSLTGGLDTRMIMAWHKSVPGSLRCYTFGGRYRACRDVIVARSVAQACKQPHEIITLGEEFLAQFPRYAERTVYLTDGCLDVSRSPALYVNERAREISPIRMAGIYGSEVLRWLPGFKPVDPAPGLFQPDILDQVRTAGRTYAGLMAGRHPVSFVLFQQAPQRGVNTLEESQLTIRSPYLDNDFVRTVFRAPNPSFARSDVFSKKDVSLRLIAEGDPVLQRIQTDRGLAGNAGKFRRALSRGWLELTFKAEYAYDYGMPQWAAQVDHLLAPLRLERLFLGRHKFYHFRVWYRDALSAYIREMLLDRRSLSRPYIDAKTLEAMVTAHIKGNRNYTSEIHKVLSMELLHRLFLDSQ